MSKPGSEQAVDVIVNEERRPLLYDAKDRPLVRAVGFQPPRRKDEDDAC